MNVPNIFFQACYLVAFIGSFFVVVFGFYEKIPFLVVFGACVAISMYRSHISETD